MTKHKLGIIFCIAFCSTLIVSNIIASKITTILFLDLPASILVFPITYIINDVFSEVYGFKRAKEVILTGFLINLMVVLVLQAAIWLPSADSYALGNEFAAVLGSSFRVLIASFASYTTGSIVNSFVMDMMHKQKALNDSLLYRCVVSTLFGETVDSTIFVVVAFAGIVSTWDILLMILSQIFMKTLYELLLYPVTERVIAFTYALPE